MAFWLFKFTVYFTDYNELTTNISGKKHHWLVTPVTVALEILGDMNKK
jgi:hypothetical protein